MTTTPNVIRDSVDPLIVTTKFDVDHEHDAETGAIQFADITAALYIQHGDSSIKLDFGVFGNTSAEYLEKEYESEVAAIDALIGHLQDARVFLMQEYGAVKTA